MSYGHFEYFKSWPKLETFTAQKLKDKEVFKWYEDAIRRVIYRNCSQIFDEKRDCSQSLRECSCRRERERYDRELAGPNETRQKNWKCATRGNTNEANKIQNRHHHLVEISASFVTVDGESRGKALLLFPLLLLPSRYAAI